MLRYNDINRRTDRSILSEQEIKKFSVGKELGTLNTLITYRKNRIQNKVLKAFLEMYQN